MLSLISAIIPLVRLAALHREIKLPWEWLRHVAAAAARRQRFAWQGREHDCGTCCGGATGPDPRGCAAAASCRAGQRLAAARPGAPPRQVGGPYLVSIYRNEDIDQELGLLDANTELERAVSDKQEPAVWPCVRGAPRTLSACEHSGCQSRIPPCPHLSQCAGRENGGMWCASLAPAQQRGCWTPGSCWPGRCRVLLIPGIGSSVRRCCRCCSAVPGWDPVCYSNPVALSNTVQ